MTPSRKICSGQNFAPWERPLERLTMIYAETGFKQGQRDEDTKHSSHVLVCILFSQFICDSSSLQRILGLECSLDSSHRQVCRSPKVNMQDPPSSLPEEPWRRVFVDKRSIVDHKVGMEKLVCEEPVTTPPRCYEARSSRVKRSRNAVQNSKCRKTNRDCPSNISQVNVWVTGFARSANEWLTSLGALNPICQEIPRDIVLRVSVGTFE